MLNEERDGLIQISNELRAEIEDRDSRAPHEPPMKRISISNISKISLEEPRNIPNTPSLIEIVPEFKEKRTGSLVAMVREKREREKEKEK